MFRLRSELLVDVVHVDTCQRQQRQLYVHLFCMSGEYYTQLRSCGYPVLRQVCLAAKTGVMQAAHVITKSGYDPHMSLLASHDWRQGVQHSSHKHD